MNEVRGLWRWRSFKNLLNIVIRNGCNAIGIERWFPEVDGVVEGV